VIDKVLSYMLPFMVLELLVRDCYFLFNTAFQFFCFSFSHCVLFLILGSESPYLEVFLSMTSKEKV
jgi:hypothetical protein